MSIFRDSRDQNLPLLTQLYQLELPAGWEENPELLIGSDIDEWIPLVQTLYRGAEGKNRFLSETLSSEAHVSEHLKPLARFQVTVRRLMDAAVDKIEPADDDVEHFNNRAAESVKGDFLRKGRNDNLLTASPNSLMWDVFPIGSYLVNQIVIEMVAAVEKNSLLRCAECNNPFVARRSKGIYCSMRCSSRVRQRNHYHKDKNSHKKV